MANAARQDEHSLSYPPNADRAFADEVIAGLSADPKTLPTRFLYDARGSELFERITALDAYYPTRTEIGILRQAAPDWSATLPARTVLVEFGSGSSVKTEILLSATDAITTYVPIDVSEAALADARARLAKRFPKLDIVAIEADFTKAEMPPRLAGRHRAGFFPGSTIGNFEPPDAIALLRSFATIVGPEGQLMIGVDLRKDRAILERAYDDHEGVTAAFNLNLLRCLKNDLGAEVDVDGFAHLALYNEEKGRVEMHLVSRRRQRITLCGQTFELAEGERIHTENSHKYTIEGFLELAHAAGWAGEHVWTDAQNLFSVHALRVAA